MNWSQAVLGKVLATDVRWGSPRSRMHRIPVLSTWHACKAICSPFQNDRLHHRSMMPPALGPFFSSDAYIYAGCLPRFTLKARTGLAISELTKSVLYSCIYNTNTKLTLKPLLNSQNSRPCRSCKVTHGYEIRLLPAPGRYVKRLPNALHLREEAGVILGVRARDHYKLLLPFLPCQSRLTYPPPRQK